MEGENMNTKQLECFLQVAEILNFSVAAKRMYVTQPTVTRHIKMLEEELGVKLFYREKKKVSLTMAGSIFYKDAQEIVMREDIAKTRVLNTKKNYKSKIAISFEANALEQAYLPDFINHYHHCHPEIYLYIQSFNFKIGIQNLLDHKMDLLLYTTREATEHKELEYRELYSGKFVCVMRKGSGLSEKSLITFEDLKNQFLIMPEAVASTIEKKGILAAIQSSIPIYYCDNIETAHILVKSGLGVSIMPDFEVKEDASFDVLPLIAEEKMIAVSYGIAWYRGESRAEIKQFISQLTSQFSYKRKGL